MNALDLLFSWFLAATLRGTLLACPVLLLQFAFRRQLPARWRYAFWLPVVFVLAAPTLPQSRWSLERLLAQHLSTQTQPIIAQSQTSPPVHTIVAPPLAPQLAPPIQWRRILAAAWLAGAGGAMGFMFAAYARAMRQIRRGAVETNASLENLVSEAAAAAGLPAPPPLLVSDSVQSPAVCGLFRPTLLLPAQFPQGFEREEAHLVLLHEMTHLLRRDLPANWLLCLLQALHWCNPALAFVFRRIRADREMACDAQVLALNGRDNRADYGHALLKLQSALASSSLNLGFVGVFGHASSMRSRIRAIAGYRGAAPIWGALGALVVAILSITGATRAQDQVDTGSPAQPQPIAKILPHWPNFDLARVNAIKTKLATITLPSMKFTNTRILNALTYLQQQSVLLDPEKVGVRIQYIPAPASPSAAAPAQGESDPDPTSAQLTLSLTNVPLSEALRYVTSLASLKYTVTDTGVEVVPLSVPTEILFQREWSVSHVSMNKLGYHSRETVMEFLAPEGIAFPPGSGAELSPHQDRLTVVNTQENLDTVDAILAHGRLLELLDKLIFKELTLKDVTLHEAIDTITKLGQSADPEHNGVRIVEAATNLNPSPFERRITLSRRDISMREALRSVANLAGMKYAVGSSNVVFAPLAPDEKAYVSKQWTVSPATQSSLAWRPEIGAQEFLASKGIAFPHGSSLEWYPEQRVLSMKNSPENIQTTEALLTPSSPTDSK